MKNLLFSAFHLKNHSPFFCLFCLGFFSLMLVGCNKSDSENGGDVLDESWFATGEDEMQAPDAPANTKAVSARLGVQLQAGEKFPLQKTVEKTLTQYTLQGPMESREKIELFMSVTVDEIRDRSKKFTVRYNRVQYHSEMNGQKVVYDSQQPPYPIPDAALAYHGMVNNGFSFWVGPDNRITDVVDFHNFMQQCLANVPAAKAGLVSETLAKYSGQEGIANFVDDTIGLLPYDPNSKDGSTVVQLGGHWTKSRLFSDPVPMSINNKYTLQELNDTYAKVEVVGDISPSAAVTSSKITPVSIQVTDGHSIGTCRIDRKTGLPLESRIDHLLNMNVQLNGHQFKQQKRVITSIRMFPGQTANQFSNSTAQTQSPKKPKKSDLVLTPASQQKKIE